MSAVPAERRRTRWITELTLGARLSVAGGRSGWARLAMISVGVGLGVAMLLLAATVPSLVVAREARVDGRTAVADEPLPRGADTVLIADANTTYRDQAIKGWLVQPEGPRAALPPGLTRQLAPGEMAASPSLARLLDADEGALLRGRWGERVVGTIGADGLAGPGEYAFYLGTDRLTGGETGTRVRSFGGSGAEEGLVAPLLLLALVGLVVLLLPVAIFVATAVRFGGEARDRQLAALRLVGADTAMTRRIAAGETLVGAVLGLVTGALMYVAMGALAGRFVPAGMTYYLADFRPVPVLAALVVLLVPVGAVLVTLSALRRVVVEPLGVVRRGGNRRRRLWWRLILPATGLALLYPLRAGLDNQAEGIELQVLAGVAALLVGVSLLLPWLVEATVRRLGGGSVAWQLAVRRLQLDSGTAVRAVSGIAVSVAGLIALQGLLAAVQTQFTTETGQRADTFQARVTTSASESETRWRSALEHSTGIQVVGSHLSLVATPAGTPATPANEIRMVVGTCAVLGQSARIDNCAEGDTFVFADSGSTPPRPGSAYTLSVPGEPEAGPAPRWTLPTTARGASAHPGDRVAGEYSTMFLVTPSALRGIPARSAGMYFVALDPGDPDALERLRNAAARLDPLAAVHPIESRSIQSTLLAIRQGLMVGATALLLLIGASMLVNVVEQLRERRRLLAVLVAFGTRRSTLTGSVLWQVAIPMLLGLGVAAVTGTALASLLQTAAAAPVRFDWFGIGATSGAAALVVLLTTAASLPLLWHLTRPGGLRSE
jgi:hypothetical protein